MRTREKQRIYKRFMKGESILSLCHYDAKKYYRWAEIEQAIRSCVRDEIEKREDGWE